MFKRVGTGNGNVEAEEKLAACRVYQIKSEETKAGAEATNAVAGRAASCRHAGLGNMQRYVRELVGTA